MPHSSKKYRKQTQPASSRTPIYVAVAVIAIIVAVAGGWYVYGTLKATSTTIGSLSPFEVTTVTVGTSETATMNMSLVNDTSYVVYAKIYTNFCPIEVELFAGLTPTTVANFVSLAKSGFYDNLVWHRIMPGFVIQTGDPNTKNLNNRSSWGLGGSKQTIPLETVSTLHNYAGYLGMARSSSVNSGSSQFYINLNNTNAASLDGQYTVFGKVISGMQCANDIAAVSTYTSGNNANQPITPSQAKLVNVTVLPSGP